MLTRLDELHSLVSQRTEHQPLVGAAHEGILAFKQEVPGAMFNLGMLTREGGVMNPWIAVFHSDGRAPDWRL